MKRTDSPKKGITGKLVVMAITTNHIDSSAYDSMSIATTFMYPMDPWAFPVRVFE
jgi:hypothetical protein